MTWLIGLFGAAIVRYIISGALITALIGAFWLWHSANYVQKAEYKHQIELNTQLRQAAEDKERLGIETEQKRLDAEQKIEELENENEKLNAQDKKDLEGNDPVILDRDDLKRLRSRR